MPPNNFQEPPGTVPEAGHSADVNVEPAPPLLTAVGARQGVISGRIVTVLGISITLAIIAMVLSYMLS
jgi:hypothetical protein